MKRLPAHVDSYCSIGEIVRQVSGSIRICCYKDPAEVLKKCGKIESVESRFCGPVKEPDGRKKRGRAVKNTDCCSCTWEFYCFSWSRYRVPYSGVNREKISLYGSRAEQGDKKEDPAAVQSAVKPEPLNLNSRSAVLMDADTGRVLYGKNETEDLPMASTTKIMTCILVLENAKVDETVSVSAYAATMPKVKLYVKCG